MSIKSLDAIYERIDRIKYYNTLGDELELDFLNRIVGDIESEVDEAITEVEEQMVPLDTYNEIDKMNDEYREEIEELKAKLSKYEPDETH